MSLAIQTEHVTTTTSTSIPSPRTYVSDQCTDISNPPPGLTTSSGDSASAASPISPNSLSSNTDSFRPSHTALPRLQIPLEPSKMVTIVRGTKRRQSELDSEQSIENDSLPRKVNKRDFGTQAGSAADYALIETAVTFSEYLPVLHQELSELREAKLEWMARLEKCAKEQMDMRTKLEASTADTTYWRETAKRYRTTLVESKIPEDTWR